MFNGSFVYETAGGLKNYKQIYLKSFKKSKSVFMSCYNCTEY